MKQKDIALILVIVIFSGVVSFFIGRYFFVKPEARQIQAEVVEPITNVFNTPSNKYFNEGSINPTQLISIGETNNVTPYNGQPQ